MTINNIKLQRYYFEQGHSNKWNIYLRRPDAYCDRFVGVVFDSRVAKIVVGWLNYWLSTEDVSNDQLSRIMENLPEAARKAA